MSEQDERKDQSEDTDSKEMRMMWIGSGAIVLLILALMGANMLFNHDSNSGNPAPTDLTSQSRTPAQ